MEIDKDEKAAKCKTLIDYSKEIGADADAVWTSCPSFGYRSGVAAENKDQGGNNLP